MLLEKERTRRGELEQQVARLLAGIARQNEVIAQLERELRQEVVELRRQVVGLTEQNVLLRQEVARLTQENAQLRGLPLGSAPAPAPETKPATPQRPKKDRKKRAPEHNRGRLKLERANRWETHAAEHCPRCGTQLTEGWIHRWVPVIDLPPVAPLEITEHRIIRRQCPNCGKRVLPPQVG